MASDFWHFHNDFLTKVPSQITLRHWEDDELNRQRSLATFKDELTLIDKGLAIYIEPVQAVFKARSEWVSSQVVRASVAMLTHAFNSYLAWRHLLTHGYQTEGRLFKRSVHEALGRALVFMNDESLAEKFYAGDQIPPRIIRAKMANILTTQEHDEQRVANQFRDMYQFLSAMSHPTLNSFQPRTIAQELGIEGLQKGVPEAVVMGGFLSDNLGRVGLLGLANDIADALILVGFILKEGSGRWDKSSQEYREIVKKQVAELGQLLPE